MFSPVGFGGKLTFPALVLCPVLLFFLLDDGLAIEMSAIYQTLRVN